MKFIEAMQAAHKLFDRDSVQAVAVKHSHGPVFIVQPHEASGGSLVVSPQFPNAPLYLGGVLDLDDWEAVVARQLQRRTM